MEILCDVWEGALDIDETILHDQGDIAGLMIRLNDISGGHHKDTYFDNQWMQAESFLRAAYFVYNPWVTGLANYDWLMRNIPPGCTVVFPDIEVRKLGYSPEIYADEVWDFLQRLSAILKVVNYTGGWFLSVLSHWPTGDYWWARYPYSLCPQGDRVRWTWQEFRQKAEQYGYHPDPLKQCPGIPKLWQCSGDKVILPGTADRAMDLNLWSGTRKELETWWGIQAPPPMSRLDILWREAVLHGWNME